MSGKKRKSYVGEPPLGYRTNVRKKKSLSGSNNPSPLGYGNNKPGATPQNKQKIQWPKELDKKVKTPEGATNEGTRIKGGSFETPRGNTYLIERSELTKSLPNPNPNAKAKPEPVNAAKNLSTNIAASEVGTRRKSAWERARAKFSVGDSKDKPKKYNFKTKKISRTKSGREKKEMQKHPKIKFPEDNKGRKGTAMSDESLLSKDTQQEKRLREKAEMQSMLKQKKTKDPLVPLKETNRTSEERSVRSQKSANSIATASTYASTVTAETIPGARSSQKRGNQGRFSWKRGDTESTVSHDTMSHDNLSRDSRRTFERNLSRNTKGFASKSFASGTTEYTRNMPSFASSSMRSSRQSSMKTNEIPPHKQTHSKVTHDYSAARSTFGARTASRARTDTLHSTLTHILDPFSYTLKRPYKDRFNDAILPTKSYVSDLFKKSDAPRTMQAFKTKYEVDDIDALLKDTQRFPPPTFDKLDVYPESYDTILMLEHAIKVGIEVQYTKVWLMTRNAIDRQIKKQHENIKRREPSQLKVLTLNRAIVAMEDLHRIGAQIKLATVRPFKEFVVDCHKSQVTDPMERNAKKIVKILSFRLKDVIIREAEIRSRPIGLVLIEGKWKCEICDKKKGPNARYQRRLHCSHIFHKKCMEEWLEDHYVCPICNADALKKPPRDYSVCYRFICEWLWYVAFVFPVTGVFFGVFVGALGIAFDAATDLYGINSAGFFQNTLISYTLSFALFGALSQGISAYHYFGTPEYDSDVWLIFPALLALTWGPFFAYALNDALDSAESPEDTLKATWTGFGLMLAIYITYVLVSHYICSYFNCYDRLCDRICGYSVFNGGSREESFYTDDMSEFTESTSFTEEDEEEESVRDFGSSTQRIVDENGESSFL